jgi:alpha-glucosidase
MHSKLSASTTAPPWWRDAVIYQVYPRSFADASGDGVGDIAGLKTRLAYLASLGVDAIWITPWYRSPMADHGYDVADFRDIDPLFGSLSEAESLIADAHRYGLRVLLDIVPNHTSDRHAWFQAALAAAPDSPERQRYIFRRGRGAQGERPPNDWRSGFGNSAWTRVTEPDGRPGEWYLHLFTPRQPDLNWDNAEVHDEFAAILRFWFDRGVDGFRIDVAHGLVKAPGLPDIGLADGQFLRTAERPNHPHWHQQRVHEIYRAWRTIADAYPEPRVFVGEVWADRLSWLSDYVRPGQLHTAFNFDFLRAPWAAAPLRAVVRDSISEMAGVGAPPTWVLSNHDVVRHVSRYGRPQPDQRAWTRAELFARPVDAALGMRRARAAALLMLALPGSAYIYQGEELGLPEVEDIPDHLLQDPVWFQSARADRGRDGCRVPLPWTGDEPPFGFSPAGASGRPWLPQPSAWRELTVERQQADPESMLALYRAALRIRRDHPALGDGELVWLDGGVPDVLAFAREPGFVCVANLSASVVDVPEHHGILARSSALVDGQLPPDTTAWLTTN